MPVGFPSIRVDRDNVAHHLWCNNGTWWVHFTVHFDHRKRRVRKSLHTHLLTEAIVRRDEILFRIDVEGEPLSERQSIRRCESGHRHSIAIDCATRLANAWQTKNRSVTCTSSSQCKGDSK